MTRPQAILFDLGETLVHFIGDNKTEVFRAGARAGHAYLVSRGMRLPPADRFVRSLVWRGRKAALVNRFSRRELDVHVLFSLVVGALRLPMDEDTWRQFILRTYQRLADELRPDQEAEYVLRRLRQAGLKTALVSNTFIPDYAIDSHLEQIGLLDLFDQRFYSVRLGLKKPSLSLFRHAVRSLDVRPEEVWHVGDDLLADVLGARRAGLTAVLRLRPGRRVRWWWPVKPHLAIYRLGELLELLGLD